MRRYTSPPPQHKPSAQNLQNHHQPNDTTLPTARARLNHKRSAAPRLRSGRQIVSLCDQCRAKAALLYDRRGRSVADNDCAACISVVLCGLRGLDVLRSCLVGVAV